MKSRYKEKAKAGEQMYGPGCCAHKLAPGAIENAKQRAYERGHFRPPAFQPRVEGVYREAVYSPRRAGNFLGRLRRADF